MRRTISGLQSNDHIFISARGELCQNFCRIIIFLLVHEETMSGLLSNAHIFNSARRKLYQDYCRMIIFLTVHEENYVRITVVEV